MLSSKGKQYRIKNVNLANHHKYKAQIEAKWAEFGLHHLQFPTSVREPTRHIIYNFLKEETSFDEVVPSPQQDVTDSSSTESNLTRTARNLPLEHILSEVVPWELNMLCKCHRGCRAPMIPLTEFRISEFPRSWNTSFHDSAVQIEIIQYLIVLLRCMRWRNWIRLGSSGPKKGRVAFMRDSLTMGSGDETHFLYNMILMNSKGTVDVTADVIDFQGRWASVCISKELHFEYRGTKPLDAACVQNITAAIKMMKGSINVQDIDFKGPSELQALVKDIVPSISLDPDCYGSSWILHVLAAHPDVVAALDAMSGIKCDSVFVH